METVQVSEMLCKEKLSYPVHTMHEYRASGGLVLFGSNITLQLQVTGNFKSQLLYLWGWGGERKNK
jgi:hypothetical protein